MLTRPDNVTVCVSVLSSAGDEWADEVQVAVISTLGKVCAVIGGCWSLACLWQYRIVELSSCCFSVDKCWIYHLKKCLLIKYFRAEVRHASYVVSATVKDRFYKYERWRGFERTHTLRSNLYVCTLYKWGPWIWSISSNNGYVRTYCMWHTVWRIMSVKSLYVIIK